MHPLTMRLPTLRATLTAALLGVASAGLAAPLTYTVQRGDTAYSVARRFGMSVDALLALAGLQSASLSAGQTLTLNLPTSGAAQTNPGTANAPAPIVGASPFVVASPQADHVRLVPADTSVSVPVSTATPSPVPVQTAQPSENTSSYTVQRGDTAYSVARRFGMSVDALLALNSLQASSLRVGQRLAVSNTGAPAARPTVALTTRPAPAPTSTVTVSSAPTLSIATPVSASAAPDLTAQMPPSSILVTPLTVEPVAQAAPPALPSTANLGDPEGLALIAAGPLGGVRERLSHLLGEPYLYGGTGAQGVDCSGLVVQVFSGMGVALPRRSTDQYGAGTPVERGQLSEGDLVFFDTLGRGQVSHVGIYIGQDFFVHANSYDGRVTVNRLSERYYSTRYLGARRVMDGLALSGQVAARP